MKSNLNCKISSSSKNLYKIDNQKQDDSASSPNLPKKSLKKYQIMIIAFVVFILIGVTIFLALKFIKKFLDKQTDSTKNPGLTREEAIKAFEPSFKVISKTMTLNQLLMKTSKNQTFITNGIKSSFNSFSKAIYDIYSLRDSLPTKEEKEFYSTKYKTVIIMNSKCQTLLKQETDCPLVKYLDLNVNNRGNLEKKDKEDLEAIREVILPICIIEHSETNIILSVTCPETLSSNIKNDIIIAFQNIKPNSNKGLTEDESLAGTSTEAKDDKIFINSFAKVCENNINSPVENTECETIRNIITDKEGNLISINKTFSSKKFQDENNQNLISNIFYTEDITNQNSVNCNPSNFKKNLDILLGLINPLLKKEEYISPKSFNIILEDLMNGGSNSTEHQRMLTENQLKEIGIIEKDIFFKSVHGINLAYIQKK